MKTKKYWILAISVCCCVSFLVLSVSGISRDEKRQLEIFGRSTLQGLKGVSPGLIILGAGIGGENKLGSLSTVGWQDDLQTQVELNLRKNGIKVLADKPPNLLIIVRTNAMQVFDNPPTYIYALQVSTGIFEHVQLGVHVMIVGGFFMRPEASFATIAPILHSAKLLAKPISLTSLFYSISFQIA